MENAYKAIKFKISVKWDDIFLIYMAMDLTAEI